MAYAVEGMSHTVLRGHPTSSQLYLDIILDTIREERKCGDIKKARDQVNLAEIIYYCMKQQSEEIYMVNGYSGESKTYEWVLQYSISLAQAIRSKHVNNRNIIILMRNNEHMAALLYAVLFTNVVPLMLDPDSTVHEILHFLQLVYPYKVFCEVDRYNDVMSAVKQISDNSDIEIIMANDESLKLLCEGYWDSINKFQVSEASVDSDVMILPTSGSSGLPKATVLTQCGLIAQLPIIWSHHDHFPRLTERVLLLSSAQWITHTVLMISCPVFGASLVMSPRKPTTDHVLDILDKFQPTWTLVSPSFMKSLAISGSHKQLGSLKTVIVTGSPLQENIIRVIKEKLPVSTHLGNGMGMTETHSFITMPAPGTAWKSNGKIVNTVIYKIVDEDGNELEAYQKGELYIKSKYCVFRGYLKNNEAYDEVVTPDGWFKTGDIFYKCKNDEVYFVERKKFWFKYLNYQIAPEELEWVISLVPDVMQCVVCDSEKGPAAAVVLQTENFAEAKELINRRINETLSDYKQLRGGVYFVPSLPCTHSGKLKRKECSKLIHSLL